jgi:uncharacterized protein YprB with RNaseH-like and TPR domain
VLSLSDKLKSLGVQVGARGLPQPKPADPYTIEQVLEGTTLPTMHGETFVVENHYPYGHTHGSVDLSLTAPLNILAKWAGDERIGALPKSAFVFLDTETTGLSGGVGTYAFLIGVGRFEESEFHLAQFFMRDPLEEPALLYGLEEFLAPAQAIISFNGKAFDAPLLYARYISHGWHVPLEGLAHIDLLFLARRLWRDRLPSRTLPNLEAHILGALRSDDDVPGWMIPELYFQYLRDGDARPLKNVFYHNAMDVLSLAALLNHMAGLLADPVQVADEHGVDLIALARLFEDLGDLDSAIQLYIHGLEHVDAREERLPRHIFLDAIQRLAAIHKRQDNLADAVRLWKQAARHQHLDAHVELAKFYEHRLKEYSEAKYWTQTAIEVVEHAPWTVEDPASLNPYQRRQWLDELRHRLNRLERLQAGKMAPSEKPASNLGGHSEGPQQE